MLYLAPIHTSPSLHYTPTHAPPSPHYTPTHLHVCAVQKCVKVGQSNRCLVFETWEESFLNRSELLCVATQPFLAVPNVHTKLWEGAERWEKWEGGRGTNWHVMIWHPNERVYMYATNMESVKVWEGGEGGGGGGGGGANLKVLLNELKVFSERKRRGVASLELGLLLE